MCVSNMISMRPEELQIVALYVKVGIILDSVCEALAPVCRGFDMPDILANGQGVPLGILYKLS